MADWISAIVKLLEEVYDNILALNAFNEFVVELNDPVCTNCVLSNPSNKSEFKAYDAVPANDPVNEGAITLPLANVKTKFVALYDKAPLGFPLSDV